MAVDPVRIRNARREAGLSLAQVAGKDVSRTFIHLVETGKSRPSREVLALIARRTGKPISYFAALKPNVDGKTTRSLAEELSETANTVRRYVGANGLSRVEKEAMRLVEVTLHQGADLVRTIETRPRSKKSA